MAGLLPGPAASNKPSRRTSTKAPAPFGGAGEDDVNPFPVDTPGEGFTSFDPLASPHRPAAKATTPPAAAAPVPVASPAEPSMGADAFDWLVTGAAKKPQSSPVPAVTPVAAAPSGALVVPEGVDPFDVYWTGGGRPLPLPDSEPLHPEPADDDEEEGEQKAAPLKKKAAATPSAAAAGDRKAAADTKKRPAATKQRAPDSDDEEDQKRVLSAAASAAVTPAARKTGPFTIKCDVLKFMRKGCPLLKFGSYGYPHFRQFQLSSDNKKLMWYSAGKAITDSQIDLRDVDEIALGQHTEKFGKHKEVTQLEKSSFSVYYNYRKKTLDVIAKDPNEFTVWTRGLHELVKRAQKNENLSQIEELILELPMQPNRRSNPDIVDVTTGKSIIDLIGAAQATQSDQDTHDKGRYKVVGENFAYMKKRILKYSEKLKQSQYYMSPQHNTMKELLKKLQETASKVQDYYHAGQFGLCDDELWRANVDLESLKNMMKAIDASID